MHKKIINKILAAFLIAAIAGLNGCGNKESEADQADRQAARSITTVKKQDMTISMTVSGEIKSVKSTEYRCELDGRATVVDLVPEGTILTQEDVDNKKLLIGFDASELDERLSQQEVTFSSAKADFTRATQDFEIQQTQNQSDENAGKLKVKFALMDLQKYLDNELADELIANFEGQEINIDPNALFNDLRLKGSSKQKKEELENKIFVAEEQLSRAWTTYQGTKKLFDKEYVARTTLEADELAWKQREIDLAQAKTTLELFIAFDFPKEIEKLCSDYHEAKLELQRTIAKGKSKMAQQQANLESADQKLKLQEENLERYRQQIKACNVYADTPGMVIYTSTSHRRHEPVEIGSEVSKNQQILTIPDPSNMEVRVSIQESWISRIRTGLPAIVTVDALEGATYSGEVSSVALTPDSQSMWSGGNPDQKLYPTRIAIIGIAEGLRSGLSAKVEVIVADIEDALVIPVQAIVHNGHERYCYVVDAQGNVELREVVVGSYNDDFIEIKEGLKENEKISLVPPKRKMDKPKELDRPKVKAMDESEVQAAEEAKEKAGESGAAGDSTFTKEQFEKMKASGYLPADTTFEQAKKKVEEMKKMRGNGGFGQGQGRGPGQGGGRGPGQGQGRPRQQ